MTNNVLIGVLVGIVVIVLIVFFMMRSTTPTPTPTVSLEEEEGPEVIQQPADEAGLVPSSAVPEATVTPTATASSPAATTKTIAITDTGFSPATLTVPANTTVTFVNNGQGAHWPASAVHPTHTVLPGFDAKRGLATGETYSFTFTKKGTWGFHDHLNPQATGSIIVQ